ncbi:hypothetical protein ACQ4LE_009448 [Meloidogyne hapla]
MRVIGDFIKLNVYGSKGRLFRLHQKKLAALLNDVNIMLLTQSNGERYQERWFWNIKIWKENHQFQDNIKNRHNKINSNNQRLNSNKIRLQYLTTSNLSNNFKLCQWIHLKIHLPALPSLPSNSFYGWTILRLVLNRNTLSNILDGAFNGPLIDSLVELDLSENSLSQIGSQFGGLSQLRNLRKLYLNKNGIAQLPTNLFAEFSSRETLLKLELRGNRLTDQSFGTSQNNEGSSVFSPLKNLQELSLETNQLTMIPSGALSVQKQTLRNLNLGLNMIKEVPIGALNFPQLSSLSLEFNGLTVVVPQAFQHIPKLEYLYLTGNKFPAWSSEMFRFIPELKTLGIGETPISVIPSNAFVHIPNLMRLEMSEAAVDTIEPGAFQRTPIIQAIVLNKNRLTRIRSDMFQGLQELYSLDLQGNRLEEVENKGFANLPALRHLDISYNLLQTLPMDTFEGTFEPTSDDRRVIYACENPWFCDSKLEWFRQMLRDNLDIDIDKPGCVAACGPSPNNCPPEGTPLRALDFCPSQEGTVEPMPLVGTALSLVGWSSLLAPCLAWTSIQFYKLCNLTSSCSKRRW